MLQVGERAGPGLAVAGRVLFSLAIVSIGVETLVCAPRATHALGADYTVIPVIPFLPANLWLGMVLGAVFTLAGLGLLLPRTSVPAANTVAAMLLIGALLFDVPRYAVKIGDMSLRTGVFEAVAMASLARLLPARYAAPGWAARASRYFLAISLIVFGADHFAALAFIASLEPAWIPWHKFWVGFFGMVLIAAGVAIGFDLLMRAAAAGAGAMFAIWVLTLHLPRVLGLYGIPGATLNPAEWSSLFIALALWGGLWALCDARREAP